MGFLDYIKSAWEWVKGAIQKVWARFKAFIVKVANYVGTVIRGAFRYLIEKALGGYIYVRDKIKAGLKKFFLIFTKKNDGFKDIIDDARKGNKIGTENIDVNDIFPPEQTYQSQYDIHVVQTDEQFNTENVYSVSADNMTDDLRAKAAAHEVSEINIKGI